MVPFFVTVKLLFEISFELVIKFNKEQHNEARINAVYFVAKTIAIIANAPYPKLTSDALQVSRSVKKFCNSNDQQKILYLNFTCNADACDSINPSRNLTKGYLLLLFLIQFEETNLKYRQINYLKARCVHFRCRQESFTKKTRSLRRHRHPPCKTRNDFMRVICCPLRTYGGRACNLRGDQLPILPLVY